MDKTTIELSQTARKRLKEERLPHESNYDETIKRLLGDSRGSLWTEQELHDMIDRRIEEHTRR